MPGRLLIVDDDEEIRSNLQRYFLRRDFEPLTAGDGAEATELCRSSLIDVVLLDLRLPDMSGLDVLQQVKSDSPQTAVIMITAYGDVETAVRAMQLRADNFVLKPIDLRTLESVVGRLVEQGRTRAEVRYLKEKVGRLSGTSGRRLHLSPEVAKTIELLAANPGTNVMITGETGTGKGLAAGLIHQLSSRASHQLVEINCAGLAADLLESELFGHVRGAFTDAKTSKPGLLEVAHRGTLFLDEIGELDAKVQAKLLKVIEDRSFRRLGATRTTEIDVRILAATNRDLEAAVRQGRFRSDLFYRLHVMPLHLPPLRQRQEDILPLAYDFLEEFTWQSIRPVQGFATASEELLRRYHWPGNIRELRNIVERAVLLCEGELILPLHLPDSLTKRNVIPLAVADNSDLSLAAAEKVHITRVLSLCDGNRSQTARLLGINRSTLRDKIKRYALGTGGS